MTTPTIDVTMRCAVSDRPFIVRFRVGPSSHYQFESASVVAAVARGADDGVDPRTTAAPREREIAVGDLPLAGIRCPSCSGPIGPVQCGRCAELVCEGRVTAADIGKKLFRCGDSCGASGVITYAEIRASGRESEREPQAAQRGPQAPQPGPQPASPSRTPVPVPLAVQVGSSPGGLPLLLGGKGRGQ